MMTVPFSLPKGLPSAAARIYQINKELIESPWWIRFTASPTIRATE
jgi:hypothetical protein